MVGNLNIRLSTVCSSDKKMDILDTHRTSDTPVNEYEVSCEICNFPNIDKTPEPYQIAKGRDFSGIEIMEADLGNLFVSNRVKKIFEILFPSQCTYKKTFFYQSKICTKWWLAIPNYTVDNGEVKKRFKRCSACNQPFHAHPGTQFNSWIHELEASVDIAKSKNWHSSDETDWKKSWIARDSFLSLRLISLLKKIAVKGVFRSSITEFVKFKQLTKKEKLWVELAIEKIGDLKSLIETIPSKKEIEDFKTYYSLNSKSDFNIKIFEKKFKTRVNEITEYLCSIKSGMKISIGFDSSFIVEEIDNWKMTNTKVKLVAFAFDDFGNCLLINPLDKKCPVYFHDHETGIYDLIQSSIVNLPTK